MNTEYISVYKLFISTQKALHWALACNLWLLLKPSNQFQRFIGCSSFSSLFNKLAISFLFVQLAVYIETFSVFSPFSWAPQKLSCGSHSLSLSFLENPPSILATSIFILAFWAYHISLISHSKRLQGCLDQWTLESAYWLVSSLLANSNVPSCSYMSIKHVQTYFYSYFQACFKLMAWLS